jgi:type II secretory pathway component GspD/PulD (secretin)
MSAPAPQEPATEPDDAAPEAVEVLVEEANPIVIEPPLVEVEGAEIIEPGFLQGAPSEGMRKSRRDVPQDRVKLTFRETKLEETIPFIVETTGKAVMLRMQQVRNTTITLVMDREVSRQDALDLLFQSFRLAGVGVVETDKVVMLDLLTEINKLQPIAVLGPDVNVYDQPEDGNICIKVFRIRNTKAQNVYDQFQDSLPDYARASVDNNSNQIVLEGDIGLAKRLQRLIDLLDVPAYLDVRTETFKLKYADASQIASIIQELFAARTVGGAGGAATPGQPPQPRGQPGQPAGRRGGASGEGLIRGTSEQLVVTVLPATNSMTVRAEPEVMEEIRKLIATAWDVPITSDGQPFRLYDLKFTDPLKVRTLLQSLLEGGGAGSTSRPFAGGPGQQAGRRGRRSRRRVQC